MISQYLLLPYHVYRQTQVDISVVENTWENSLDPRDSRRGFWNMDLNVLADVSQGWEERVQTLDPYYCGYMDQYYFVHN